MFYDVAIIGAGPAGLFCAYELKSKNKSLRICIVDKGKSLIKRKCYNIGSNRCLRCDICSIAHGVGGAGLYSDGKMSSYPAGSEMSKLIEDINEIININKYVVNKLTQSEIRYNTQKERLEDEINHEIMKQANMQFKSYNVIHMGSDGIRRACDNLENELIDLGVELILESNVIDVNKYENIFTIEYENGNQNNSINAESLVIATGKATGLVFRDCFSKMGVEFEYNSIEMGVRVETLNGVLDCLFQNHLDAKLKLKSGEQEVRTFCICNGGYITRCFYDSFSNQAPICTISGYSQIDYKSPNTNFGLLVRTRFDKSVDPIKEQLSIIQKINAQSPYGTIYQTLEDFVSNKCNTDAAANSTIKSTLGNSTYANLNSFFPCYVIQGINNFFKKIATIVDGLEYRNILLHAPMWELINDKIALRDGICTSVEGLYVIGDACGWARGIVQASTFGVIAANNIIKRRLA